jgi:16S rRNA (guanine966-N2)-methyltransferase
MRIYTGKYKNKKISINLDKSNKILYRPTQSKVRTAVLNKLSFSPLAFEGGISDRKVLDICCGCGAFGLETLSRDAAYVCFIDKNPSHVNLARKNAISMGANNCEFLCADASLLPINKTGYSFDIAYIDPPYFNNPLVIKSLNSLYSGGWLTEDAIIVVEVSSKQHDLSFPAPYKILEETIYGASKVIYSCLHELI